MRKNQPPLTLQYYIFCLLKGSTFTRVAEQSSPTGYPSEAARNAGHSLKLFQYTTDQIQRTVQCSFAGL